MTPQRNLGPWLLVAFTLLLTAGCFDSGGGSHSSGDAADDSGLTSQNHAPLAKITGQTSIVINNQVTLASADSDDSDGDTLTFTWSIITKPTTSAVQLSSTNEASTTFTPDVAGKYSIRLIVSDGIDDSEPETFKITAVKPNQVPQAHAGTNANVLTGTLIALDGSLSSDPESNSLTYAWQLVSAPKNSQAQLSDASHVSPSFTPDYDGEYLFSLIVSDGTLSSTEATVAITSRSESNVSPRVTTFTSDVTSGERGDTITFSWSVADVNNDSLSCVLDLTGSGTQLQTIDDCSSSVTFSNKYVNGGTYLPRITVSDGNGGQIVADTHIVIASAVTLNVNVPTSNALVGEVLGITASISSVLEINSVTARVGDREIELTYDEAAICTRGSCRAGFTGEIALTGLSRGEQVLEVIAEDIVGSQTFAYQRFVYDQAPLLNITLPKNESVASPIMPIDAVCTDDDENCRVEVLVNNTSVLTDTRLLLADIDLSANVGSSVTVTIRATDSAGQITEETRHIYVEDSPKLTLAASVEGEILDLLERQLLYRTTSNTGDKLYIHDWFENITAAVPVLSGITVSTEQSFVTAFGTIFIAYEKDGTAHLYDWHSGLLNDLGRPDSSSSLSVSGDYAIWNNSRELWRLQLSSGHTELISDAAGNWQNGVGDNGVVAYWSTDYAIKTYASGTTTTLAQDSYWNTYVITDGNAFVYRKHDACCSNQTYSISYHNGTEEIALTAFRKQEPSPGRDYQINNGWVAYTDIGNLGQLHVWSYSASGERKQRTLFGTTSTLEKLGDDGSMMIINSGKRYYSSPTSVLSEMGTSLGKSFYRNGNWYVVLGQSLFEMELD